ncbi:hypothetical protein PRUPE_6G120500 [Prunus persica]|uniref:Uncharacterized protein n=1 Tax=Prunus persica TaxID=3760 RepID=M5WG07_PRUPE|nr:hypothetical protein PRUPE_6G120500 [Prunus persica]
MHDGVVRSLSEVRHIPELRRNLISIDALNRAGYLYKAKEGKILVTQGLVVIMRGEIQPNNVYQLLGDTIASGAENSTMEAFCTRENSSLKVLDFKGVEVAKSEDKVHKGEVKTRDDRENVVGYVAIVKVLLTKMVMEGTLRRMKLDTRVEEDEYLQQTHKGVLLKVEIVVFWLTIDAWKEEGIQGVKRRSNGKEKKKSQFSARVQKNKKRGELKSEFSREKYKAEFKGKFLSVYKGIKGFEKIFQEIIYLNTENVLVPQDNELTTKWHALINQSLNKSSNRSLISKADGSLFSSKLSSKNFTKTLRTKSKMRLNSCSSSFEPDENGSNVFDISKILMASTRNHFKYNLIASKQMIQIFDTIWARKKYIQFVSQLRISCKEVDKLGRNLNVLEIFKSTQFLKIFKTTPHMMLNKITGHDMIIWLGDLNYNITLNYSEIRKLLETMIRMHLLTNTNIRLKHKHNEYSMDGNREKFTLHLCTNILIIKTCTLKRQKLPKKTEETHLATWNVGGKSPRTFLNMNDFLQKEVDELERNLDVLEIFKSTQFPKIFKITHHMMLNKITGHDMIIWLGDLNYNITMNYSKI